MQNLRNVFEKSTSLNNLSNFGQYYFLELVYDRIGNQTWNVLLLPIQKPIMSLFQSDDKSNLQRYREIGRAMATVMSDEIFHEVPYKAKSREQLLAGIDKFLDAVTVLPPGMQ